MTMALGQEAAERAFLAALAGTRLPPVWLLSGPQGVGKASFAHRAAAFVLSGGIDAAREGALSLDLPPDHPVLRLIDAGAHGELLILERAEGEGGTLARNITVEQVRTLIAQTRTKPVTSPWRVVIIDSIDDCERGAANALLKTLEEPPDNSLFLLISHAPGRLLPTIRSRCRSLRFSALDPALLAQWLAAQLPEVGEAERAALVTLGQGSPGRALAFASAGAGELDRLLTAIADSGDGDNRLRSDLARLVGGAARRARFEAVLALAALIAARRASEATGDALGDVLDVHARITDLRRFALSSSEDPATVAFAIGTALAALPRPLCSAGQAG